MSASKIKDGFNIWKMAILKVALLTFVSGAMTFQTAMAGLKWNLLDRTSQFLILLGVCINMSNTVIAFLDRTMSRIENDQKVLFSDVPDNKQPENQNEKVSITPSPSPTAGNQSTNGPTSV